MFLRFRFYLIILLALFSSASNTANFSRQISLGHNPRYYSYSPYLSHDHYKTPLEHRPPYTGVDWHASDDPIAHTDPQELMELFGNNYKEIIKYLQELLEEPVFKKSSLYNDGRRSLFYFLILQKSEESIPENQPFSLSNSTDFPELAPSTFQRKKESIRHKPGYKLKKAPVNNLCCAYKSKLRTEKTT